MLTCLCCARNMSTWIVSKETFRTPNLFMYLRFKLANVRPKKKCSMNHMCIIKVKVWGFTMFQVNLISWVWACIWIICQHAASNSGGWAGVPIEIFSVCPSLVSRFPTLCKHRIRSERDTKWKWKTYVKPNVNFVNGQRCGAQSYVWCAMVKTFRFPLDCQSGKNKCVRSLVSFQCFMSVVHFREGESECRRCGSLMFLGFVYDVFWYV